MCDDATTSRSNTVSKCRLVLPSGLHEKLRVEVVHLSDVFGQDCEIQGCVAEVDALRRHNDVAQVISAHEGRRNNVVNVRPSTNAEICNGRPIRHLSPSTMR